MDNNSARLRFDQLTEEQKTAILDKYRHWNTGHDWWDSVYDQFSVDMSEIGVCAMRMYFSGFWSQGDGACFDGYVDDWHKFLPSLGYTCPALINHAARNFRLEVSHSGHYYHENCTNFSADLPLPNHDEDEDFAYRYLDNLEADSVQEAVALALLNQHCSATLKNELAEALKDHMRELYKRLEAEYDHLTSDEAILDSLEANEELEEAINEILENDNA